MRRASIYAKVGDEEERKKVGEKSDLKKGRNPGRRRRGIHMEVDHQTSKAVPKIQKVFSAKHSRKKWDPGTLSFFRQNYVGMLRQGKGKFRLIRKVLKIRKK